MSPLFFAYFGDRFLKCSWLGHFAETWQPWVIILALLSAMANTAAVSKTVGTKIHLKPFKTSCQTVRWMTVSTLNCLLRGYFKHLLDSSLQHKSF